MDKNWIVTSNGKRVKSGLSESDAKKEAEKLKKQLNESQKGQASVEVKQNIMG